jgi:DNA-binding response OmpR family regulator
MPMAVPAAKPSLGAETILIVEDEVLIRWQVADYLRQCGYQVFEAVDAAEAVVLLQSDTRIDLVFSDIQLGAGMDGFGLARWVRANRPRVKVILSSGVARSTELAGELCDLRPVVSKPYQPQVLLERIRLTLAQARRS